jgi:hypothetical protein
MSQASTDVIRLKSSHSPFLSQPEKISDILIGITA